MRLLLLVLVFTTLLTGCSGNKAANQPAPAASQQPATAEAPPADALPGKKAISLEGQDELAEFVESLGGRALRDTSLPEQPVQWVTFSEVSPVPTKTGDGRPPAGLTDAKLRKLATLEIGSLTHLSLVNVQVSEEGLSVLQKFPSLYAVGIGGPHFSDLGLQNLCRTKGLTEVGCHTARLTNEGLKHLHSLPNLKVLNIGENPQITDAGIAHLAALPSLTTLELSGTGITDLGLSHLKSLKSLQILNLNRTKVTDAGLKELLGLKDLFELNLYGTAVTHSGATPLKQMPALVRLNYNPTVVLSPEPTRTAPDSPLLADVEKFITWLPEDTETYGVARGPLVIDVDVAGGSGVQNLNNELEQQLALPFMGELRDRGYLADLKGLKIGIAIRGTRKFHLRSGVGAILSEGCRICVFENDLGKVGDELFVRILRDATGTEEIGSHRAARFEIQEAMETITVFVVRPKPNVIMEATDLAYLRAVLGRMDQTDLPRPAIFALPAWKTMDPAARFSMFRNYSKMPGEDITSPFLEHCPAFDADAKSLSFEYPSDPTKQPTVFYHSTNAQSREIVKKTWGANAKVEAGGRDVWQITYPITSINDLAEFSSRLFWQFGSGGFP